MRSSLLVKVAFVLVLVVGALVVPVAAQEAEPALVRVVHASADAPAVDITLDGVVVAADVTFGQATDYFALPAGSYNLGVNIAGEATPVVEATLTLQAGQAFTAVAMGAADDGEQGPLAVNVFRDDLSPLELGMGRLVLVHAASLDTVDVLTADGDILIGGVGAGKASPPVELAAGAYDLAFVAPAVDDSALPGSGMLYVNSGTLHTVVLLDGGSLSLTAATAPAEEPAATLRLAHASPDAPPVDVYLDDTRVVSALAFGSASESIAVAPGDYAVSFYVAGADPAESAVTAAALPLNAGDARTLLVMGNLDALQLVLFADDTAVPTAGNARLTTVHAYPGAPDVNVALTDGTVIVENLGFGQQSAGVEIAPGAYDLGIAEADTGQALLQLSRTAFAAGRAYTVVVVPSPQGLQIVQPLVFSTTPPVALAAVLAAKPDEAEAPATEEAAEEAVAAAPTPVPTQPPSPQAVVGTVIVEPGFHLTVRRGPGQNYDPQPFRGLPAGAEVEVRGRNPESDWLYIRYVGEQTPVEGWVFANFVTLTLGTQPVQAETLPLAIGGEQTTGEAVPATGVSGPSFGGASFSVSDFRYSEDGRQAFMVVNVTNNSLQPALASGNWYPQPNPDGGRRWVTLFKSTEDPALPPMPIIDGNAPLWEFIVTLDTGLQFRAYAGCDYYNEIVGEGFEPTAEGGFNWTQVLSGGWFRCGRDYDGSPKPPNDLLPGESYTVPLNIWLVHPHAPVEPGTYFGRIIRLDFVPKAPDGASFGVQASVTLQ